MATQALAFADPAGRALQVERRALSRARVSGVHFIDIEAAFYVLFIGRTATRAAMAEIERNTRSQPFRVDTSAGPLFGEQALWEFAGRSGWMFARSTGGNPTWPRLKAGRRAA